MQNTVPVTLSDGLNTQDRWYTDAASIDTRQASHAVTAFNSIGTSLSKLRVAR